MAKAQLFIEKTERQNHEETKDYGRIITRYTPHLGGEANRCPLFSGRINFAVYEVWGDEPEARHQEAQANALQSAKKALARILQEALA